MNATVQLVGTSFHCSARRQKHKYLPITWGSPNLIQPRGLGKHWNVVTPDQDQKRCRHTGSIRPDTAWTLCLAKIRFIHHTLTASSKIYPFALLQSLFLSRSSRSVACAYPARARWDVSTRFSAVTWCDHPLREHIPSSVSPRRQLPSTSPL